jgi:hypothetical protein
MREELLNLVDVKVGQALLVQNRYNMKTIWEVVHVSPTMFTILPRGLGWKTGDRWYKTSKYGLRKVGGSNHQGDYVVRYATKEDIAKYDADRLAVHFEQEARQKKEFDRKQRGVDLVAPLLNGPFAENVQASFDFEGKDKCTVEFYGLTEEKAKLLISLLKDA